MRNVIVGMVLVGSLGTPAFAQDNTIDGLDAEMHRIDLLVSKGHSGTYPTGLNGLSFDATICNIGSANINWDAAMAPEHPFIAFLVATTRDGRFQQISGRSYVKHTFSSQNLSECATCTDHSDSTQLAVGCSDTYSSTNNADRYWLGPPTELDPWLLDWDPVCSYFDRGDPAAPPPDDCDGVRSLTHGQADGLGPTAHRIEVADADLDVSTAKFFYYGQYLIRGEADALRDNTCATREFVPTCNGTIWTITTKAGIKRGTILTSWTGAKVRSNSNGGYDGRVFLASLVTGPDANGLYHYEYAMHNRDNGRAIDSFQLPICPGASVVNAGFRDIDVDSTNDWSFEAGPNDVAWSTTTNPVEWNTIYNFWFDSDTAPAIGSRAMVSEFRDGAGLPAFTISTEAPTAPDIGTDLGFGKAGGNGLVPDLSICGGLGFDETADLVVRYAAPNALAFLFVSDQNVGVDYHGGIIVPFPPLAVEALVTDGFGEIIYPAEGVDESFDLFVQVVVLDPDAVREVAMTVALEVAQ